VKGASSRLTMFFSVVEVDGDSEVPACIKVRNMAAAGAIYWKDGSEPPDRDDEVAVIVDTVVIESEIVEEDKNHEVNLDRSTPQ